MVFQNVTGGIKKFQWDSPVGQNLTRDVFHWAFYET